ncbi:MAG: TolB family protein [Methanobacteriota archaeon]
MSVAVLAVGALLLCAPPVLAHAGHNEETGAAPPSTSNTNTAPAPAAGSIDPNEVPDDPPIPENDTTHRGFNVHGRFVVRDLQGGPAAKTGLVAQGDLVVWAEKAADHWDLKIHDLRTNSTRTLLATPANEYGPEIGDGYVAYFTDEAGYTQARSIEIDTGKVRNVSGPGLRPAEFTASGSRIVFFVRNEGVTDVYVYYRGLGDATKLDLPEYPRGGPRLDGDLLVYVERTDRQRQTIVLHDLATGDRRVLWEGPSGASDPVVSDGHVAWRAAYGGRPQTYDVLPGTNHSRLLRSNGFPPRSVSAPTIAGGILAWTEDVEQADTRMFGEPNDPDQMVLHYAAYNHTIRLGRRVPYGVEPAASTRGIAYIIPSATGARVAFLDLERSELHLPPFFGISSQRPSEAVQGSIDIFGGAYDLDKSDRIASLKVRVLQESRVITDWTDVRLDPGGTFRFPFDSRAGIDGQYSVQARVEDAQGHIQLYGLRLLSENGIGALESTSLGSAVSRGFGEGLLTPDDLVRVRGEMQRDTGPLALLKQFFPWILVAVFALLYLKWRYFPRRTYVVEYVTQEKP